MQEQADAAAAAKRAKDREEERRQALGRGQRLGWAERTRQGMRDPLKRDMTYITVDQERRRKLRVVPGVSRPRAGRPRDRQIRTSGDVPNTQVASRCQRQQPHERGVCPYEPVLAPSRVNSSIQYVRPRARRGVRGTAPPCARACAYQIPDSYIPAASHR